MRVESPIKTDFPSKTNLTTDTSSKALRQRQPQEKRSSSGSSHRLFSDMRSSSPCGNHSECTGGERLSPKAGKTTSLHRNRTCDMTSRDSLQVQVAAASDEAGSPTSARQPQPAGHRKAVEAASLPSLWMPTCWDKSPFPRDTATERGAEAVKDSKAASRKLENWLALGKPKSAEDLAKILAMPPGSAAHMFTTAAGRPTKSPHEGETLIHTSASCANLAVERRRDTHCPVRAASGTLLALRRDEGKKALHPVVANTRRLGTSRVPSICKSSRRA